MVRFSTVRTYLLNLGYGIYLMEMSLQDPVLILLIAIILNKIRCSIILSSKVELSMLYRFHLMNQRQDLTYFVNYNQVLCDVISRYFTVNSAFRVFSSLEKIDLKLATLTLALSAMFFFIFILHNLHLVF